MKKYHDCDICLTAVPMQKEEEVIFFSYEFIFFCQDHRAIVEFTWVFDSLCMGKRLDYEGYSAEKSGDILLKKRELSPPHQEGKEREKRKKKWVEKFQD